MDYINALKDDPGYNIAILSKEMEEYNKAVHDGLNIVTSLEEDIAFMSREDYDVNNSLLLEVSINNYNNVLKQIGMGKEDLFILSKEDMAVVVYDDIQAKARMEEMKGDKKSLIKKIIEWIKNIISKIINAIKKMYRNVLVYVNRFETRCASLLKDIEKKDDKIFYTKIVAEFISRHAGAYAILNNGFSSNLLNDYMRQDTLIDLSIKDINTVASASPIDIEKLRDNMWLIPGQSLYSTTEKEFYSRLERLPQIFKGLNKELLLNSRALVSTGNTIKFVKVISDTTDDVKVMLETRNLDIITTSKDNLWIVDPTILNLPNTKSELKPYIENILNMVKNSTLKKAFDGIEKKLDDVTKELKKSGERTNQSLIGVFNSSMRIHASIVTIYGTTLPIGYVNLMNDLLNSYDVMINGVDAIKILKETL